MTLFSYEKRYFAVRAKGLKGSGKAENASEPFCFGKYTYAAERAVTYYAAANTTNVLRLAGKYTKVLRRTVVRRNTVLVSCRKTSPKRRCLNYCLKALTLCVRQRKAAKRAFILFD
jgi:hypothetical protein